MSGRQLILITFTGEHAAGGVPRWVRDFKQGFPEAKSYCWQDLINAAGLIRGAPSHEWEKAGALAHWLKWSKYVEKDDIIIVDGYWGKGWEDHPNVISVCHGIWSHLIKEEADAGRAPDFPLQHAIQVDYRRRHLERGGRLVAVSQFIQHQMEIQWGFRSTVINNCVDLERYRPASQKIERDRPLIIHGVNDRGNKNKGWDHIEHLKNHINADVKSLDQAYNYSKLMWPDPLDKYEVLAQADLVVIPSGYEGNSYFALETLACDVPVVAYKVGLFHEIDELGLADFVGDIIDRQMRFDVEFTNRTKEMLEDLTNEGFVSPRSVAERYSLNKFHKQWRDYLKKEFDYESPTE